MFHVEHFSSARCSKIRKCSTWNISLRPPTTAGVLRCYSALRAINSPLRRHRGPLVTSLVRDAIGGTTKVNIASLYDTYAHCAACHALSRPPQRRAPLPKRTSHPTCYSCDSCRPWHIEEPIWIPPRPLRREMRLCPTRGGAGRAGRALDRKPRRQIAATFPPVARAVINQSASCLPRGRAPRIAESQPAPANRIPRAVAACAPPAEIR